MGVNGEEQEDLKQELKGGAQTAHVAYGVVRQ